MDRFSNIYDLKELFPVTLNNYKKIMLNIK